MSPFPTIHSNGTSDLNWDAFVASLHRVWEYAPDYCPTGPVNLSGRRILVADQDNDHNAKLSDRLMRMGSLAVHANTLETARAILTQGPIDLMVMGTSFPDGDSLAFCRSVCDSLETMNIPVIILSDEEQPEMVWLARRAGAKFYLRKPYDPYVLLALLAAALETTE